MSASLTDIIEFGENQSRGPLYNKSVTSLGAASYTLVLSVNPSRKFLAIQPHQHPVNVHFLTPGANANTITDSNSIQIDDKASSNPFVFDTFVPTNAVYLKSTSGSIDVTIFES